MVKLENTVVEAILDTGGAKTIVSRDLACDLNWEVETPPEGKSFGSYLGPVLGLIYLHIILFI